jgi:collagenase-like PrtC family protease
MENIKYLISARGKSEKEPIFDYFKKRIPEIPTSQINGVFGFVDFCTMYGGRAFKGIELSDDDIKAMYNNNVGLRLPLTNHDISHYEYEKYYGLLSKYHRKGNSVVICNDDLVAWIRNDFPLYSIHASSIKNISTLEQINEAENKYDTVVLPMSTTNNVDFLSSIPDKDKIMLFANGSCGVNCPNQICFDFVSKNMKLTSTCGNQPPCSKYQIPRKKLGIVNFDINNLTNLGFHNFKLLPLLRPNPSVS